MPVCVLFLLNRMDAILATTKKHVTLLCEFIMECMSLLPCQNGGICPTVEQQE